MVGIGSFTQNAEAGLIHHSIKVKNTTSGTANILLVTADGDERRATINSNSEHTFSIGPKCAKFLKGGVSGNYAYGEKAIDPKYLYYCVRSGRATDRPALCVMSCSSSSHKISLITLYNGSQVYTFESE